MPVQNSGNGGYYSDSILIPLPIALIYGVAVGSGQQGTFIVNTAVNTSRGDISFRIMSINSRQSVYLPIIILFAIK